MTKHADTMTPAEMKAVRTKLGLSQTQMARMLKVSSRIVGAWEREERIPSGPVVFLYECLRDHPRIAKAALAR